MLVSASLALDDLDIHPSVNTGILRAVDGSLGKGQNYREPSSDEGNFGH